MAMQSTLHSFTKLMRLLEKSGMMSQVQVWSIGMAGMARCAVAEDVQALPEAMRMVVGGAAILMLSSGAAVVK